jgi:hypothetical protein
MSSEDEGARSDAEQRLDEHLDLLRHDEGGADLTHAHRIVAAARWQRALRAPVKAIASVVGAVADGLRGLVGAPRRGAP